MHRYTGRDRYSVGVTIANRMDVEAEDVIGLRQHARVPGDLPGPTSARFWGPSGDHPWAPSHIRIFRSRVVESSSPHGPESLRVYQCCFCPEPLSRAVRLPGLNVGVPRHPVGTARRISRWTSSSTPTAPGSSWTSSQHGSSNPNDPPAVPHLERCCSIIVDHPELPFRAAPPVRSGAAEDPRRGNATEVPQTEDGTVARLSRCRRQSAPDAPAVRFETESLSYRELDRARISSRKHLRRHGVHSNVLVGSSSRVSIEMLVAVLAVMKAGGAMSRSIPHTRRSVSSSCGRRRDLRGRHPAGLWTAILASSRSACALPRSRREAIPCRRTPGPGPPGADDLAYVIYTSGSNRAAQRRPDCHRSLANVVQSFRTTLAVTPRESSSHVTRCLRYCRARALPASRAGAQLVIASRTTAQPTPPGSSSYRGSRRTIMQATTGDMANSSRAVGGRRRSFGSCAAARRFRQSSPRAWSRRGRQLSGTFTGRPRPRSGPPFILWPKRRASCRSDIRSPTPRRTYSTVTGSPSPLG